MSPGAMGVMGELAQVYSLDRTRALTVGLLLDAISMHTHYGNGANFDASICWRQRFADILEPARDWSGAERLRESVYVGRVEEGALLQTGRLIE